MRVRSYHERCGAWVLEPPRSIPMRGEGESEEDDSACPLRAEMLIAGQQHYRVQCCDNVSPCVPRICDIRPSLPNVVDHTPHTTHGSGQNRFAR